MNIDNPASDDFVPARKWTLGIAAVAGLVAVFLRVVPHPPNFSGVGALGLFGGARMRAWQACLWTLGTLFVSDLLLWTLTGFDAKYSLGHLSRSYVYVSFLLYIPIGRWLQKRRSLRAIALASTAGAVQFFIVTNFCVWLFQPWQPGFDDFDVAYVYSRDLSGLLKCFTLALPFYQGDLPLTAHPFMLFTDFRLSLFWIWLGDFTLTAAYMTAQAKLSQVPAVNPQSAARA